MLRNKDGTKKGQQMTIKTKTQKTVEELNVIDDTLFQKMAEDKGFCEELISTVLQQKVIVEKVIPQNSIKNLQGRSVILDAYCVLEDGRKCNVEVQKENDDDHVRRVRYNASCLTANITSTGTDFKEVPDIIMIFVSKFDIFKAGKTIYHIDRVVREIQEVNDNGVQEIYVNTKVDDGSLIAKLMKIYQNQNEYDFENFPNTSNRKKYFKENEGGQKEMCDVVKNYAREYAKEYAKECTEEEAKITAKKLFERGVSFQIVQSAVNLSEEILKKIYEEVSSEKCV